MPNRRARKSQRRRDVVDGRSGQILTLLKSPVAPQPTPNELTIPLSIFDPEEIQAGVNDAPQLTEGLGDQPIAGGAGDGRDIPAIPVAPEWPMGHGAVTQDIFLPLDLLTRFRMRKVNRTFRDFADDPYDNARQYLDINMVLHHYWLELVRHNVPVQANHFQFVWSMTAAQNLHAQDALLFRIGILANAFPMPPNGTLILKFDLGLDPNGGGPVLDWDRSSRFLTRVVLGHFQNATRVIFTDSCLYPEILGIASTWPNTTGRVWFVRSRFHCPDLCGHLVKPLYVHRYRLANYPTDLPLQRYTDLMDSRLHLGDKQALKLLKHTLIRHWDYSPQAPAVLIGMLEDGKATFQDDIPGGDQAGLNDIKALSFDSVDGFWIPSSVYLLAVALKDHKRVENMPSTENINACPECSKVFLDAETHDEAALAAAADAAAIAAAAANAVANQGQNGLQNNFGNGGGDQNAEFFQMDFGGGGQFADLDGGFGEGPDDQ